MKHFFHLFIKSALLACWLMPRMGVTETTCLPNSFEGSFSGEMTLCQNWNSLEQQKFWFLSQGSQIIPYFWFLALEQPDNSQPFRESRHMDGFRYLPQKPTLQNPDALPIGFTKTQANVKNNPDYQKISDDWLGLTCAACHTGQIEYQGKKMLIDGAPTMADFENFIHKLTDALQATYDDTEKFDRFAKQVLGLKSFAPGSKDNLRKHLGGIIEIRKRWNGMNAGDSPYGFARLDAIGAIFNTITVNALELPENRHPANAPVSYPFIWDTPHHDKVQWNGSVPNRGTGALGRNVGEVLGVFASLELNKHRVLRTGHLSSADIDHLGQLEALLWRLRSPQWPDSILPKIDKNRLAEGRQAYEQYCLACHADIERDDPNRRIKAVLTPLEELKTDPNMTANFSNNLYASGNLLHRSKIYISSPNDFKALNPGVDYLGYSVIGTIIHNALKDLRGTLQAINAGRTNVHEQIKEFAGKDAIDETLTKIATDFRLINPALQSLVYKARPLNGIWATAPYLHNGSVRTLRQLLLPAAQRQNTFHVGSREFDSVEIGFKDEGGFVFDASLKGNSNAGHEYGAHDFAAHPAKLEALLEYLKTL